MKFEAAIIKLRNGKKIKHEEWAPEFYLSLDKDYLNYFPCTEHLISDKWEVLEEPGKTFPEVFKAFKEGKGIRRREWSKDAVMFNDGHEKSGIFYKDLLANDWEIL